MCENYIASYSIKFNQIYGVLCSYSQNQQTN